MYIVVFRNISGSTADGAITWTGYQSKEDFDQWYDEKMQSWYEVVEEGVTRKRALELCSSPKAVAAIINSQVKRALADIEKIAEMI